MRFFSGNEGIAKVDSITLCVTKWEFTDTVQEIDTTNACQSGFYSAIGGTRKGTGTIDAHFDAENNPWADPPNLQAGIQMQIELFLENSSGPVITVPTALITSMKVTSMVNGVVTISANFVNIGPYTLPTNDF